MADKASSSAAKDASSTKTVLELLEEDDEFEVRSLVKCNLGGYQHYTVEDSVPSDSPHVFYHTTNTGVRRRQLGSRLKQGS